MCRFPKDTVGRGFKTPLHLTNEPMLRPFIHESHQYICGLKLVNGQHVSDNLRKTAVVGLIISSFSAVALCDLLVV